MEYVCNMIVDMVLIFSSENVDSSKWLQNHTPGCQDEILEIKKKVPTLEGKTLQKMLLRQDCPNFQFLNLSDISTGKSLQFTRAHVFTQHFFNLLYKCVLELFLQMLGFSAFQ